MNIVSQFDNQLNNMFQEFLLKYSSKENYWDKQGSIDNYIKLMKDVDSYSQILMSHTIKSFLEYIDEIFFQSSYRKNFCESKGFYERTILTLFGEITYKRRYYYDKKYKDRFFFTDMYLGLPKRKYFDPFICAEICEEASVSNYSKTGKIISKRIGTRIDNCIQISRASSRNIVMRFNPEEDREIREKQVERLYVMLDEKFVGSQYNDQKDFMIKAAIVYEGTEKVYKTKRKKNSMNRYKLVGSHVCASIDDNLRNNVIDYIYDNYDIDYIKEIYFMGDCAFWIKQFPKSYWFNFTSDTKVVFSMDGFHFSQALNLLTTQNYKEVRDALFCLVEKNDKTGFKELCREFKNLCPNRIETIESKENYILNNWTARQHYQNNIFLKCSMESHISHIFADLFTARPKAYSEKGLNTLLNLRLLKVNGNSIKELFFKSLKPKIESSSYECKYSDTSIRKTNHYNLNLGINNILLKYNLNYSI